LFKAQGRLYQNFQPNSNAQRAAAEKQKRQRYYSYIVMKIHFIVKNIPKVDFSRRFHSIYKCFQVQMPTIRVRKDQKVDQKSTKQ